MVLSFWSSSSQSSQPRTSSLQYIISIIAKCGSPACIRMCHQSPAKILRNVKRMTNFIRRISSNPKPSSSRIKPAPSLSIVHLPHLDISPSPQNKLSFCSQKTVAIPPANSRKPKLSPVKLEAINIRPKKIYHPTIINACETMFQKHPDQLSKEEIDKFNQYRKYKLEIGDPLEANPIYLPIGGLRKCLICANLT